MPEDASVFVFLHDGIFFSFPNLVAFVPFRLFYGEIWFLPVTATILASFNPPLSLFYIGLQDLS